MSLTTVHKIQAWEYASLAAHFTTTNNATPQQTGLKFTPEANKSYWFRGAILVSTSLTTAGVCIGIRWPTGSTFACGRAQSPQSRNVTDPVTRQYGALTPDSVTQALTLDVANEAYLARIEGSFVAGASPVGDVELLLQVESGAVATAKVWAGSNIQWWDYSS